MQNILDIRDISISNINEIKNNTNILFDSFTEENGMVYRTIINKVFIIDLYTTWEQFVKKSILGFFDKYKNILFSDKLIIKKAFNEKIKRAREIKLDDNGAVKYKDLLINSNNMKYKAFEECISSIGGNIYELSEWLIQEQKFRDKIFLLKNSGVELARDENINKEGLSDIADSIYTIVQLRNEYAHSGKTSVFFNKEQIFAYCDVLQELINSVSDFLCIKLYHTIYSYYSKSNEIEKLYIKEILYENKPNKGSLSCSLKIQSDKQIKNNIRNYSLFLEYDNKFYSATRIKLEDLNENTLNEIPEGEFYITLDCMLNIKRERKEKLKLFIFSHKEDYAYIKFV